MADLTREQRKGGALLALVVFLSFLAYFWLTQGDNVDASVARTAPDTYLATVTNHTGENQDFTCTVRTENEVPDYFTIRIGPDATLSHEGPVPVFAQSLTIECE